MLLMLDLFVLNFQALDLAFKRFVIINDLGCNSWWNIVSWLSTA